MSTKEFSTITFGADALGYSFAREIHNVYGIKTRVHTSAVQKYTAKSRFTDYHVYDHADDENVMIDWLSKNAGQFNSPPLYLVVPETGVCAHYLSIRMNCKALAM